MSGFSLSLVWRIGSRRGLGLIGGGLWHGQSIFQGVFPVLHVWRDISISCPRMKPLVKGGLRHLRDRGGRERHIIIWQLYLAHQVIYLLLVLCLCLVKISHHDGDLS